MDISVRITGDKELVRKLRQFAGGPFNLMRSMSESGRFLTEFFAGEVFASRGGVIREPWQPLNPNYAVWKAKYRSGRPMLVQTGEMIRSFKSREHPRRLELWNAADHFEYHQGGHGVPQRVMMKVDEQRARRVAQFIADDLGDQLRKGALL